MHPTANKIVSKEQAADIVLHWQQEGYKVVFTNGCFDIVHLGHIDYLEKARRLGSKLVVGLNTDKSVSHLKGPSRPIINEYSRARLLAALEFVDSVVLFDEETPICLIEALKPDILVKANDYTIDKIVGADFVIKNGGSVQTVDLVEGFSTSSLIEKIKNQL